jgi:hypothetical protein
MESKTHAPSEARAIIQAAKHGGVQVDALILRAQSIPDPSFAAEALFAISSLCAMPTRRAGGVLDEAGIQLAATAADWRKAEALADLAGKTRKWRSGEGEDAKIAEHFVARLLGMARTLPPGPARSTAIKGLAPVVSEDALEDLLTIAANNAQESRLADCKLVLRRGPVGGLPDAVGKIGDVALRARLLAYLHAHGGKGLLPAALATAASMPTVDAVEVLRGIVAATESLEDLQLVAANLPQDAEAQGRLLSAIGARADRLADPSAASRFFEQGQGAAAGIEDAKRKEAVLANLKAGVARLSRAAPDEVHELSRTDARPARRVPEFASTSGARHVLALYDTYEGRLGEAHKRAVARAAPLCAAFGLDLALVGFPARNAEQVVDLVRRDTGLGEQGTLLAGLAKQGRLILVAAPRNQLPDEGFGAWVATTPSPNTAKACTLAQAAASARAAGQRRLAVLMGLGPRGLPAGVLQAARYHVELTGSGVSLETATAMGILAERLRSTPAV